MMRPYTKADMAASVKAILGWVFKTRPESVTYNLNFIFAYIVLVPYEHYMCNIHRQTYMVKFISSGYHS